MATIASAASWMAREMREQPEVLASLLGTADAISNTVREVLPRHLSGITLVARGSSDHAAIYGRYLLESVSGTPTALAAPSLSTLYGSGADYHDWLAVAVSQSGETADVLRTFRELRRQGAVGIAITNVAASPLAGAADLAITLGAGPEEAIPATKTFTAELAAFLLLAGTLGNTPWTHRELEQIPEAVAQTLDDVAPATTIAVGLAVAESVFCTARGYLLPIALEAALKLKEVARLHAEGYSSAELRHGPIVLASARHPVITFRASGPAASDIDDLAVTLRRRGSEVWTVADDPQADLPLPRGLPEPLVAFPAAVRAQQLALLCADLRGLDPDRPEGLAKVTR